MDVEKSERETVAYKRLMKIVSQNSKENVDKI